jgi:hypothetical protein
MTVALPERSRQRVLSSLLPGSRVSRSDLALVWGFFAFVAVLTIPQQLVQDSWLMLVDGREVADHGIPSHDHMTIWSAGARWVDQQWLGQLAFYRVEQLGGVKLALLLNTLLLVAAFSIALRAARRLGGSPVGVAAVALIVMFMAPWELQMRTQTLAELFFVATLWLVVRDIQARSRRIWLVVPLLCLWANVHGSVVLGALLVSVRGALELLGKLRSRKAEDSLLHGAALLVLPWLCVLASPYGLSLVGYYRTTLLDSRLRNYVLEWQASTPAVKTAVFYLVALFAVAAVARWGRRVSVYERFVLLLTLVFALSALRNIIWFGLTALVVLPRLVDGTFDESQQWRGVRDQVRSLLANRLGKLVVVVAVLGLTVFTVSRPDGWFQRSWPPSAVVAETSGLAGGRPVRILSDDRYADWLLWKDPGLRGQIAYDLRFELLSPAQLTAIRNFHSLAGQGWSAAEKGYAVVVLNPATESAVVAAERRAHPHASVVESGATFAAFSTGGPAFPRSGDPPPRRS